ncbi:uncharacterized protein LOC763830 [Strongylocentrotus purpuratus]|uniref:Uncharacterized protein n=1 Tax=Strongylocentrotus purpuratus TaxID=7668 RepID=A0A7M7NPC7_STRPU|nr:uncharacterized protein LOC763830 [Strongylocentrotus purpuratus]
MLGEGQLDDQIHDKPIFSQPALIEAQKAAEDLKKLFDVALPAGEAEKVSQCYFTKCDVLMRKWCPAGRPADEDWAVVNQIVVPPEYRQEILRLSHDIPVAGHLGVRKTVARIEAHFHWPGLRKDVSEYRSCHACQVVGKPQHRIKPAPLIPIPVSQEPFSRVLIDCVGPLPKTRTGSQYLLTIMDTTTRFPEAFPLRNIKAKTVIDALLMFFTRYGLPHEIQSDQGSNFTSNVFQEVMYQLGIKQINSSAYHPQSQGALERYHQTLKTMIKSYCLENSGDWDKGIPFLLFASRDTPNDSTGFTPFELVFGHEPRGPLKVVKEQLLSEMKEESENVLDYVSQFRERLSRACELAGQHLKSSQVVMKARADKKAESRSFEHGDKVLVLLPMPGEPLRAKFSGPYMVERKLGKETYLVSTPDRRKTKRVCHINMLKKYYDHEDRVPVAVVCEETVDSDPDMLEFTEEADFGSGMSGKVNNSQVMANPAEVLGHLSEQEQHDVIEILCEYPAVCTDKLGCTLRTVHDVDVGDSLPIKQHPYRLNPRKKHQVQTELQYMLDCGIVEPSQSCWSSPVVLVPKPDGSQRFCIDYRKVNAVTKPDSFPLPRIEDCIDQVGSAKFITKLDLMKGYWQVPLSRRAKEVSAFVTPQGLFQCRVMPFGMRNAPATFQRLMTDVIAGLDNVVVYIDDILVFSDTWSDHLAYLRDLFDRLTKAGLVVNLAKCEFAKATVTYLGHEVGRGHVVPRQAKVQAIVEFPAPSSKKEVMRFLGMCGFYRKFVPNFSDLVAPLTDLLKKGIKFEWSSSCEIAFQKLKAVLMSKPVLDAPNFQKPFQLATDASDVGVGAVLLQMDDMGLLKPISYFSKKLNPHQRRYSTIEKECLGLVLAVQHFDVYISNSSEVSGRDQPLRTRLVGGSGSFEGRVEVLYQGAWGTVCDDLWGLDDAHVVCHTLGYLRASAYDRSANFGQGTGEIILDNVQCTGSESNIAFCEHNGYLSHNCGHYEDAGVTCDGIEPLRTRLVGGSGSFEGRVEVYYQGAWGTVCDDLWGLDDAHVVCHTLGYPNASAYSSSANFGQGTGEIILDNVQCTGSESNLAFCQHNGYLSHNCVHSEDAGVTCDGIAQKNAYSDTCEPAFKTPRLRQMYARNE